MTFEEFTSKVKVDWNYNKLTHQHECYVTMAAGVIGGTNSLTSDCLPWLQEHLTRKLWNTMRHEFGEEGRTCKPIKEYFGQSGQAYRMVCSECHHVMWDGLSMGTKPNYCQNCGAKVVR